MSAPDRRPAASGELGLGLPVLFGDDRPRRVVQGGTPACHAIPHDVPVPLDEGVDLLRRLVELLDEQSLQQVAEFRHDAPPPTGISSRSPRAGRPARPVAPPQAVAATRTNGAGEPFLINSCRTYRSPFQSSTSHQQPWP